MANPFTVFSGGNNSALTSALLAPNSGISINTSSLVLNASGSDAVNFYDGSLSGLGIGSGLLLTSGTTPGTNNTVGWFGKDNHVWQYLNGDTDINAVVASVFSSYSYDATTLSFDFTATDPTATSVSFDVVFGSDEFPEWVDQFVDCAVVMVNGVNYALFNHDPNHPLSVVSSNLAAGYFQDNAVDPSTGLSLLPIEYDGISHVLKIVAPINVGGGTNHIKIGIADTGDHIYDSGVFLANFSAGNIPGSGLVAPTDTCTESSDAVMGSTQDEYFDLLGGDDTVYAGGGDDIVVAGNGNDVVYGGSGNDELKGGSGDDCIDGGDGIADIVDYAGASIGYGITYNGVAGSFTITDSNTSFLSEGVDTLTNVEYVKFTDGFFELGVDGLKPATAIGTPPHINTVGTLAIGGIGSVGNTLTAMLNDADGISGPISYQWQISSDKGATWSDISGAVNNSYLLSNSDGDKRIQVTASYIDNDNQAEAPVSVSKEIFAPVVGDLTVTLMKLAAPAGTSVINPLTTLIKNAVDLGLSPNEAAFDIKAVLGIPAKVTLQSYDAYWVLQSLPSDPTALTVEKVAVQVAILTSLSDDDTGMNLTIAILNAAANNQTLNLADLNDLCFIFGVDPQGSLPDSVSVIFDRNKSMSDALADGGDVTKIENEWVDLCGINDTINSTSIADLSIHINQVPVGSASASLPVAQQDAVYTISSADLLQGYSDPDGDVLAVSAISADTGGYLQENGDGTWSFIPDSGYTGPVELTYTIGDTQGASITASQLFVVSSAPPANSNNAPTGAVAIIGEFTSGQTLSVDITTLADADGLGVVTFQWQADGVDIAGATGDTLVLGDAEVGTAISVITSYTDGYGTAESIGSNAIVVVASGTPNNTPIGEIIIFGDVTQEQTLMADITALEDADGLGEISIQWQADGIDISGATGSSYTLTQAEVGRIITVKASYTDGLGTGEIVLSLPTDAVVNIDDLASGTLSVSGAASEGGALVADLADVVDLDGKTTTNYQWEESVGGVWVALAAENNATLSIPSDQSFVGKVVRVVATTVDELGGTTEFVGDAQSIANVNDAPTGTVKINGNPQEGQTLSAANTLADADGLGLISYQWKSGGVDISGATASSYTLTLADVGKVITVLASYIDGQGTSESAISLATAQVTAISGLTLTGTAGANVLSGGTGSDALYGLAGNDKLNGNAGNDTLDGGTGADTLAGGAGNDTYVIDNALDKVTENAGEGSDLLQINVATAGGTVTLTNNVENATIFSAVAFNLTGNALGNVLTGNAAANALNGGAGADTLIGGAGNDTYTVDSTGDLLVETVNGGTDLVKVNIATAGGSYTLADNVENATLQSTVAFNLIGSSVANTLTGNDAANSLTGAGGNDILTGGQGVDTFNVDADTDTITDLGKGGSDIIKISEGAMANAAVSVSWTATSATANSGTANITTNGLGVNLGAVVTGNGYNVTNTGQGTTLTGSGLADLLSGSTGKDTLIGGNGNDVLNGGNGNDALTGGAGSDTFLFSAAISKNNVDVISDFQSGSDKISLLSSLFANIKGADGVFNSADLLIGAGVTKGSVSGNEHLIFSTSTKALYYDADGSGAGAGAQFATLTGVTTLADTDFMVS